MNGCAKHNRIDFSSSEAFFSSLNKKKLIQKKNEISTSESKSLKMTKINNKDKHILKKPFSLNASSYETLLKQKIG